MVLLAPKGIRIFKTCNLYLCFFVLGLCVALPGPTLLDLQNIVQTDTQHIALIYTARSVGYLLGSFLGGVLFDVIKHKQCVMTIFSFVISATMFGIPWSRSIEVLTALMVVNGLSLGAVDTGGNVCCLHLWGKDSPPFFQALHFSFGFGGLVAPLVAAPFLGNFDYASGESFVSTTSEYFYNTTSSELVNYTSKSFPSTDFYTSTSSSMLNRLVNYTSVSLPSTDFNSTTTGLLNRLVNYTSVSFPSTDFNSTTSGLLNNNTIIPTVTYAFTAVGVFSLLVSVLFLFVAIISPIDESAQKASGGNIRKRSLTFVLTVVILNICLLFVETGTEIGYAQMLTTYCVKGPLKISKTTGSYMTSTFWAAFTLSRFATVFLAIKLSNFTLIVSDLVVTSIGAAVLLFLGATYEWSLWLSSALLGIGIASFFPATIGWLEEYIEITNKIASIFTVGAAFGEMVVPYVISYYIADVPQILLYVVMASCVFSVAIVLLMYMVLRKKQPKYMEEEGTANAAYDESTKT